MRSSNYTLLPLIALLLIVIFFTTCKDDDLLRLDSNNNLVKKSFPIIDISNITRASNKADVYFYITNIEDNYNDDALNDTLVDKRIYVEQLAYSTDSIIIDSQLIHDELPVTSSPVEIVNLVPGLDYRCWIMVETKATPEDENRFFFSDTIYFSTPKITLELDDEFIEDEQRLKVSALAQIKDYGAIDKSKLTGWGFRWRNPSTGEEREIIDEDAISILGAFTGDFYFFNYFTEYEVDAFVDYDGERIYSTTKDMFNTNSNGDFWVNMAELPILDENGKVMYKEPNLPPLSIPALEGAVSFTVGDTVAYVCLGKKIDNTLNKMLYKYTFKTNLWEALSEVPFALSRMYATKFTDDSDNIYVGGGCGNCHNTDKYDNFIFDNKDTLGTIQEINGIDGIEIKADYYQFNPENEEFVMSGTFPGDEARMAAYGFKNHIGGGLTTTIKKGDLLDVDDDYEDNQIDPFEWHDLNDNGIQDPYTNNSIVKLSSPVLGCIESEDSPEKYLYIPFCDKCATTDTLNTEPTMALMFRIKYEQDMPAPSIGYNFKKYNTEDNKLIAIPYVNLDIDMELDFNHTEVMMNEILNGTTVPFFIKTQLQIEFTDVNDSPNSTTVIWIDKNDNGVINITTTTATELYNEDFMEITDLDYLKLATNRKIKFLNGDMILERTLDDWSNDSDIKINGYDFFQDAKISLGTVWCDTDTDQRVDINDELYVDMDNIDSDQAIWTEWIDDENPTTTDIYNTLAVSKTYWMFGEPDFTDTPNENRYAAAIWEIQNGADEHIHLVGGYNNAPIDNNSQSTDIYRWAASGGWGVSGISTSDFKPRIHPFSFTIEDKGYIGGGEFANGEAANFDLWEFAPNNSNPVFDEVAGCGVSDLSKGVGFSNEGKGYVLGTSDDELAFYLYIPCISSNTNSCN